MLNKLIFTHIPKTAGVSVRSLIGQYCSEEEIFHITNPVDYFKKPLALNLDKYKFIHGHFGYDDALRLPIEKAEILVFLRDPIKRVISFYRFLRMFDLNTFNGTDIEKKRISLAKSLSFREFVSSNDIAINAGLSNRQLTFISEQKSGVSLADRLDIAKDRLITGYKFFGITEDFDRSMQLLAYTFGFLSPKTSPSLNASSGSNSEISDEGIEIVKERNSYDLNLYAFAKTEYEKRISKMMDDLFVTYFEKNNLKLLFDGYKNPTNMNLPIIGNGWYERETSADITWRFSGPDKHSTIFVKFDKVGDRYLKFSSNCAIDVEILQSIKVFISGIECEVRSVGRVGLGDEYQCRIPEDKLNDEYLKVEFRVPYVKKPSDIYEDNGDYRKLGFALTSIYTSS